MVATSSMATRSSLELMLDKLQQLDDDQPNDIPPALPARPVSRARLPRARSPLQLDGFKMRNLEESDASLKWSGFCKPAKFDHFQKGINVLGKNSNNIPEKEISNIQKCYRGYKVRCYYNELRRGTTALQSFIRGENARRGYDKYTKDWTQVPYSVLIDLRKQVLRTEAKVRETKEINVALKMQIQEMDKKWEQYEEKMKSLEKKWQDELTNIQECLVGTHKNQALEIRFGPSDSTPRRYVEFKSRQVDRRELVQVEDNNHHNEVGLVEHDRNILHPHDELRKLKHKFKAWKKDYKCTLRDTQSTLKKIANSETAKCQKNWWGRISH